MNRQFVVYFRESEQLDNCRKYCALIVNKGGKQLEPVSISGSGPCTRFEASRGVCGWLMGQPWFEQLHYL